MGLDISNTYPEKIKSLLEEVRWHKEKHLELTDKLENEEKQIKRQKEHALNLEDNKRELEIRLSKVRKELGVVNEHDDE